MQTGGGVAEEGGKVRERNVTKTAQRSFPEGRLSGVKEDMGINFPRDETNRSFLTSVRMTPEE